MVAAIQLIVILFQNEKFEIIKHCLQGARMSIFFIKKYQTIFY